MRRVWNRKIQLRRIDSQLSVIIPGLIDSSELVTLSISYVMGSDICLPAPYVNVVGEICSVMRLYYTQSDFCVMFRCFSWHNLRYIKNQQNHEMFNANIIVLLQGIMYVHNRQQPCGCAHMWLHTAHLKIYSVHASRRCECQGQTNRAAFICKVSTLCITRSDLILLPFGSPETVLIWSTLAKTYSIFIFEFMSTRLQHEVTWRFVPLVQMLSVTECFEEFYESPGNYQAVFSTRQGRALLHFLWLEPIYGLYL